MKLRKFRVLPISIIAAAHRQQLKPGWLDAAFSLSAAGAFPKVAARDRPEIDCAF